MTTTPSTPSTPSTETADDFFLSLTGFDEIAINKAFGADIADLREKPFRFLRALIFVHQRRQGSKDPEAYRTAMSMPVSEVGDYFPDAEPELDPDDPDTESGKDDAPSV